MRLSHLPPTTISSLICLLPLLVRGINLNCEDARDDGVGWNFKKLEGRHAVSLVEKHEFEITNTTFTFDICRPLTKTKGFDKDCPIHSHFCAVVQEMNPVEGKNDTIASIGIAGRYELSSGGDLAPRWSRLKSSDSPADREKEGVRLSVGGGKYGNKKQKAFVDFICIRKAEERRRELNHRMTAAEDEKPTAEEVDDGHGGKISFRSWEDEGEAKALRLDWHTQYACEDAIEGNQGSKGGSSKGHWGFFTWFILIVFMGVAAYLIFGSWLNYTRYSARGWDLVPHSDTIRDLPYLFRDWMRRVVDTVQGGGSRGGYSAV